MRPSLRRCAWACLAVPLVAGAAEGLPGSTWGELHLDRTSPGSSDLLLEGWARQGVAWARWEVGRGALSLQGYATLRYKWDTEGLDWNGYLGPGAGVSLDLQAPGGPSVSAGLEAVHEWGYRSGSHRNYLAPFVNWYHGWDLAEPSWPGSTWGELRWQLPSGERSNLTLQGWIRQGRVVGRWRLGEQILLLDPYLRIRWTVDTQGLAWNNALGPGVGLALDLERQGGPLLSCGAEYGWEKNLRASGGVHRATLFLRWYAWWDLRRG